MSSSPFPAPRLEIFRYDRNGKTRVRAYCQLNNGTEDWAVISMTDGVCDEATWRKNKTIEEKIERYRAEGAEFDLSSAPVDGEMRGMLERLAEAAQKYNKTMPPLVVDDSGAIVHADASGRGRPRKTTPLSSTRKTLRNLHVWI